MSEELKSCPFCGGNGKLIESHRYDASVDPTPPHWKVSCECIGCNGAAINIWRQTPEDAIEAWNTRHEPDTLPSWAIKAIGSMKNWAMQNPEYAAGFGDACDEILTLRKTEDK